MIARAPTTASGPRVESDRVFLDANVLFSAAYRQGSGLEGLSGATNITLMSSPYAIEEANRNLDDGAARSRLHELASALEIVPDIGGAHLPTGVTLPEKELPILLAAIAAAATHLLTGDRAHFGRYFGRRIAGVLVQRPGDYLAARR